MNLKLNSTTIYVSVLVVIVIIFGIVYTVIKQPDNNLEIVAAEVETANIPATVETIPQKIVVHIVGEIVNPDVYTLDAGSRIKDVIDMAGGVTADANIEYINLAAFLNDADQIIIPKKQSNPIAPEAETETIQEASSASNTNNTPAAKPVTNSSAKININTADATELMRLDGIGEAIANSIIIYRNTNGRFNYIEDIKHVDRIGVKTYNKIKDHICVN